MAERMEVMQAAVTAEGVVLPEAAAAGRSVGPSESINAKTKLEEAEIRKRIKQLEKALPGTPLFGDSVRTILSSALQKTGAFRQSNPCHCTRRIGQYLSSF